MTSFRTPFFIYDANILHEYRLTHVIYVCFMYVDHNGHGYFNILPKGQVKKG